MGANTDDERFDEVLKGHANITGAINTAGYTTQFTVQPDASFEGTENFDEENVWYEVGGGTVASGKPLETVAVVSTDGTGGRAALESETMVYRPGTHTDVSGGIFVPDAPTGDGVVEVLYGRERNTAVDPYTGTNVVTGKEYGGYRIREDAGTTNRADIEWVVGSDVDGDDVAEENVVPITGGDWGAGEYITEFGSPQPAEVYGFDPLDGTGPSGITFDERAGYVLGVELGWYGPTGMLAYLIETGNIAGTWKQRKWPVLLYNPHEAPAIKRPNQPIRINVDEGTSGDPIEVRVGGRKGAYRGEVTRDPAVKAHTQTDADVPATGGTVGTEGLNWYVVGVVKPRAQDPDAVIAPNSPTISVNQNAVVQSRIVDEADLSGTIEYDEPSNAHRNRVVFAIDAKADTPDRLSVGTVTVDGESKFVGVKVGEELLEAGGANKPALNAQGDFGFTVPRDKVLVYMVAVRTNNDGTVDAKYGFESTG